MIIGVPREIKHDEYRVAMLPVGAEELTRNGHTVLVEAGAGLGSGLADHDYLRAGAKLVSGAEDIYGRSDMVVKVKEPLPAEWSLIRAGQTLFAYFHFAASRELTEAMIRSGATCLAYETLRDRQGRLPLLTPMSEVAGRMSVQEGAKYLERPQMGRGILLGGVPGVAPAHITILGGGVVGANAARIAAGFQADVNILDINMDRLRYLDDIMPANVNVLFSDRHMIREQLQLADLVIGAVLIPGAKAPRLILREDLLRMKPGSVIIDVAIDQGRDVATDDAQRPDVHRRGGSSLLCDEHAGGGWSNEHVRIVQCHVTMGRGDCASGRGAGDSAVPGGPLCVEHLPGQGDQRGGGCDVRPVERSDRRTPGGLGIGGRCP